MQFYSCLFILMWTSCCAVSWSSSLRAVQDQIPKCDHEEGADCSNCHSLLVSQVTEQDGNYLNLSSTLFPPNASTPVFVTVTYHYLADNGTEVEQEVWFWSTATFYIFHPLHVFQFTSLFFSETRLLAAEVDLTLHSNCSAASEKSKQLFTQRVSKLNHCNKPLSAVCVFCTMRH